MYRYTHHITYFTVSENIIFYALILNIVIINLFYIYDYIYYIYE